MNQLGPIFKEAREKSGKSIDDAVKETKIAKKYLIAIENENFDIFPGETYLIGFIRNYAQFLGLDPDEMVQRYKSYKIQEQPTPIEQLTARPKKSKYFILISIIVFIISISVVAYFNVNKRGENIAEDKTKVKTIKKMEKEAGKVKTEKKEIMTGEANKIVMDESELIKEFIPGDIIVIPQGGVDYTIKIDDVEKNLDFTVGKIPFTMEKDEIVEIDFDKDGRKDVMLKINSLKNGSVNLTLKRIFKKGSSSQMLQGTEDVAKQPTGSKAYPEVVIYKESELNKIPIAPAGGFIILTGYERFPINVKLEAKNTCYVGYIIDGEEKLEKLLNVGEKISFTAKDRVRLMLANAGALDISVNNVNLNNLISKDVILVKDIAWYLDRENKDMYDLVLHKVEYKQNKQ